MSLSKGRFGPSGQRRDVQCRVTVSQPAGEESRGSVSRSARRRCREWFRRRNRSSCRRPGRDRGADRCRSSPAGRRAPVPPVSVSGAEPPTSVSPRRRAVQRAPESRSSSSTWSALSPARTWIRVIPAALQFAAPSPLRVHPANAWTPGAREGAGAGVGDSQDRRRGTGDGEVVLRPAAPLHQQRRARDAGSLRSRTVNEREAGVGIHVVRSRPWPGRRRCGSHRRGAAIVFGEVQLP